MCSNLFDTNIQTLCRAQIFKNKTYSTFIDNSRQFLTYYIENQLPSGENKKDRGKNLAGLCLDGLVSVINIVSSRDTNTLCQCLINLGTIYKKKNFFKLKC